MCSCSSTPHPALTLDPFEGFETAFRGNRMKRYTCNDYRQEMMLAGLRKQLADPKLSRSQKERLEKEIKRLESEMGLD